MAITYDAINRIITVTGYTLGVPCTFTDLYNADKAGTLSLHARAGIAGVDGAGIAVDRAERPTDYVILGGASGDLYITVTNWNLMTNATIDVIGTDRDGNAQTDSIVVNANGNYNTALWFRTITHTQITVFNTPGGGTFDYDLIQGQWGEIFKTGDTQFRIDCRLYVGDGIIETYFADEEKQVLFYEPIPSNWGVSIYVKNNAEFRVGTVEDVAEKTTDKGCSIRVDTVYNVNLIRCLGGSTLYLYASMITGGDRDSNIFQMSAGRIWNTTCLDVRIANPSGGDFYNIIISGDANGMTGVTGGTWDTIYITETTGWCAIISETTPQTYTNLVVYNCNRGIMNVQNNVGVRTLLDCTTDDWSFRWLFGGDGPVYRSYSYDLKTIDRHGNGIAGATVTLIDTDGNQSFSVATDGSGDIATQVVIYKTYMHGGGGSGDTVETTQSPHTLIVRKSGYKTIKKIFDMDEKREEIEVLDVKREV